jgi:hypothetical protein
MWRFLDLWRRGSFLTNVSCMWAIELNKIGAARPLAPGGAEHRCSESHGVRDPLHITHRTQDLSQH